MTPLTPEEPLCFVLMPFGLKPDSLGERIDFDAVYGSLIKPAIEQAGMKPIRADNEEVGGIIQKPMFERLILCDFAVADLTTANANVFYELGVRHGIRPQTTVSVFANTSRLPFDVQSLRAIPYSLAGGKPDEMDEDIAKLAAALDVARADVTDSPVFQLVDDLTPADLSRLRTDVFREQVDFAARVKGRLRAAQELGEAGIEDVRSALGPIRRAEAGIVMELFFSYRAVQSWDKMIALVDEMAAPLAHSVLVREQLSLALNRAGRAGEAERILLDLIEERGPSSETYGILGRVYKDRWVESRLAGEEIVAHGHLANAINAYLKGFEADWRDAYPGLNAVTLMDLADPPDPRREDLLPIVRYRVSRRVAGG